MVGIVRSELIRLRRRSVLIGWTGLAVLFTVLVVFVLLQVVDPSGDSATDAPGVAFRTAAELLSRSGIIAGLPAASSFLGVVTLSFWALTAAGDSSTGLIRVLVFARGGAGRAGRPFRGRSSSGPSCPWSSAPGSGSGRRTCRGSR